MRKKKTLVSEFPLWFHISFIHNHEINRQDHKRLRSVGQETKDIFTSLFEQDFTPTAAWEQHRKKIKEQYPDDYALKFGDRHLCPDYFWVFKYYRKWIQDTLGSYDGVDAYAKVVEFVNKYNEDKVKDFPGDVDKSFAKVAQTVEGETCVVICDQFMQRVHKMIPQSGDLLLMDATSNVDRSDSKIFHLMCPSPAGGLPLATLVTTREDAKTIEFALELLKSILPPDAFYGRGPALGPALCMTDDSDSEKLALSSAWPQVTLLLCQFHLLQALWQWLWSGDHKIEKHDRAPLLKMFRKLVYSDTETLFELALSDMKADPLYKKYPQFKKHIETDVLPRKDQWSLLYRVKERLPTSSVNTTNYVESSFRWTKETQFNRHRAYNLMDLLKIVMDDSQYHARRCIDMGNNTLTSRLKNQKSRYLAKKSSIDVSKIVRIDESSFSVPSETIKDKFYTVDMNLRLCTCYLGQLKGPCKHKNIVSTTQDLPSFDIVPTESPEMRALYMYLGTGKKPDSNWFKPLSSSGAVDVEPVGLLDRVENTEVEEQEELVDFGELVEDTEPHEEDERMNEEKVEILKIQLRNTLAKLEEKIGNRIDKDLNGYDKALDIFEKQVERLPETVDGALQNSLCTFGKVATQAISVAKRKKGNYINVQVTAKSRRAIPIRGSRAAYFGAPRKNQQPKVQLYVTENEDVFAHKLPGKSNKKKKKHLHDLMAAVTAGRSAEKKH